MLASLEPVPVDHPKKIVVGVRNFGLAHLVVFLLSYSKPGSDLCQLFELVLAIKLEINCSSFLLPQEGQVTAPFSCSFNVNANRHSLPHFRHL